MQIDEKTAREHLDSIDEKYEKNDPVEKAKKVEEFHRKKIVEDENGIKRLVSNAEINNQGEKFSFESRLGWIPLSVDDLPTGGIFYSTDTKLEIRSASVEEIKHWSTLDPTNFLQINENLNFILKSGAHIYNGVTKVSYKWDDIIEIDRLYIIFRISELTFPDKNNKLVMHIPCGDRDNTKEEVFITSDKLHLLDIDSELYRIYDENERCFVKNTKDGEKLKFYLPTVSVATAIKKYLMQKRNEGENMNPFISKILPCVINDGSLVNDEYIEKLRMETVNWSKNKVLYVNGIVDLINESSKMIVKHTCEKNGAALEVPLFFRGEPSIKNLFSVSEGLDELI